MHDIDLGHLSEIREEANSVKDCFTKFSFQAFALEAALIGFVLKYQKDEPLVTFAIGVSVLLMVIVSRIGTHKYATANRNFAFELFNSVSKNLQYDLNITWEEALRAWRIVQATAYDTLFETTGKNQYQLREEIYKRFCLANNTPKALWFQLSTLLKHPAKFHAGSYLRTMIKLQKNISYAACLLFLVPFLQFASDPKLWNYIIQEKDTVDIELSIQAIWGAVFLVFGMFLWSWVRLEYKRRFSRLQLLEEGFLSIHSCAKMWHAVVVAHKVADLRATNSKNIDYFTELGRIATYVSKHVFRIDLWIKRYSERFLCSNYRINSDAAEPT